MADFLYHFLRGLIGIAALVGLCTLLSRNRALIQWSLVLSGLLLQFVVAVVVLKVPEVRGIFDRLASFFVQVLDFTREGSLFLFGGLVGDTETFGFIFAFQILPSIVFFAALTSALYYLNILQYIVYAFAWVMSRTMKLSGAESLAAAANIFVGQTEAPLVVKPYIDRMSRSEIMALMTGGMATIAGAVLAAYVGLLGGADPDAMQYFATHLLVASIISAPAALVAAKILIPETQPANQELLFPRHRMGSNLLDAIAQGTTEGVKLAVNVAAMLLVFIAFIAMANYVISEWIGAPTGLNERVAAFTDGDFEAFNLQFLFGLALAPVAWLLGVPGEDLLMVGRLLGEKTVLNEFVAYVSFAELKAEGAIVNEKSILIATYALCGFSNFSSIGIQIGGISVIAPDQRTTLCELGLWSLVGGTIACLLTACLAGMLV